ncbi:MAG TPA: alpha/beta fold hydrolase [Streptosporangiaceae bacterium]|nr:alpha/beta fold hydrolase [Streptosporangiaceae bacterium]
MNEDVPYPLCGTPELPPKCVALTYDDGPGPRTAELARLLRDEGVPGTFFVLGESIEKHGAALEAIRDCGHVIGLHADRHYRFKSAGQAAGELRRCAERIGAPLGETPWFRPPYGEGDWPVAGFAGPVGWHAQGRDWDVTYRRGQTVQGCVDSIADGIIRNEGGIVLLHDFAPATEFGPAGLSETDLDLRVIEITKSLVERLRGAGFSFVALPEQARAGRGPRASGRAGRPMGLPADDFQAIRLHRATARAAGGILDLLMPIRVGGDGPSLFCAYPLVGLSWCYLSMLPYVDDRYRLYGLQARGLRRPEPLPASMEEMARDFADLIRQTQPSGPYNLLGWSLGGNIAFAVAEELQRRGDQIGLLVILDSSLRDIENVEVEPWEIYNLVLAQFGYMPSLTAADQQPELSMLEVVRRRPGLGLDGWPSQRLLALQRVIRNNAAIARVQRFGRLHCPLLFFSASRNPPELSEKLANWGTFVDGPIDAVELDCGHRHMLLPESLARLGPALSAALARAEAASKTPIV